jgi:hypothetical protein
VTNTQPTKIHHQLVEEYGEGVMNERNVHNWCCLFNGESTDVHNEAQSGLSVITGDLKDRVDVHIHENTNDELHKVFTYVSRSVIYETVTVKL